MKRILAAAVAAVAMCASADWVRVGTVQVADFARQGDAASRLGTFMGNPLAAAGMAAVIADMPTIKFFGPMREKSSMVFPLFFDGDRFAKDPVDALNSWEFAVLYPMSDTKDAFLARHPGSSEKDGVIAVKGDAFDAKDKDSTTYVVFSEDGRWAGASDKPEQAKAALKEIALAEKPLDGDVARLRVGAKAFKAFDVAIKKGLKCCEAAKCPIDPGVVKVVESMRSFSCGLRVSDSGIDIRGSVKFADGSELASCGQVPLAADPLAFAGRGAISASARADGVWACTPFSDSEWNDVLAICGKYGLDLSRFILREKGSGFERFTLDFGAIREFAKAQDGKNGKKAKIDGEKIRDELKKRFASRKSVGKSPAYSGAMGLKGFESQWTVAERFAATLPEAAKVKPSCVGFFSISSIVAAVAKEILAFVPEEQRQVMSAVVAQLAKESKCGTAGMCWPKKGAQKFFLRISADECRTIGSFASTAMMLGVMSNGSSDSSSLLDDDDDDD